MTTFRTRGVAVFGLLIIMSARTHANDIVDFLRAINGIPDSPQQRQAYRPDAYPQQHVYGGQYAPDRFGNGVSGYPVRSGGSQPGNYDPRFGSPGYSQSNGIQQQHGSTGYDPESFNRVSLREYPSDRRGNTRFGTAGDRFDPQSVGSSRGQVIVRVGSNSPVYSNYEDPLYIPNQNPGQLLPPVQSLPSAPNYPVAPLAPSFPQSPIYAPGGQSQWQLGQFVDCQVPLARNVYVEDECNIAPDAVPVVIAVRDPASCGHGCRERMVFVQVLVPPCPPHCVTVSPCRTRVSLDYGQYQVDIKTCEDHLVVDYDN